MKNIRNCSKRFIGTICLTVLIATTSVQAGAIHQAVVAGDLSKVRELIEANLSLLNSKDNTYMYYTPLHYACENKQVAIANYLLDKGANVTLTDEYQFSALSRACGVSGQDTTLIQRLIDKGSNINLQGYNGLTPLHMVASGGDLEVAKLLIKNGANLNIQYNGTPGEGGFSGTVLQVAINFYKNEEMAKLLVESGAKPGKKDSYGNTELHLAALKGYTDLAKSLINHDATVNAVNTFNRTALYYAAKHGYRTMADALIAAGADPNTIIETNYGKSPQLASTLREGEAWFWYLGGLGYAVKTKEHLLIFNPSTIGESIETGLANGHLNPNELAGLKIMVLITTTHDWPEGSVAIQLAKSMPGVDVVLGYKPADSITDQLDSSSIHLAVPDNSLSIDGVKVVTIPALGGGVGYLVEANGTKVFHSGLHLSDNSASNVAKYRKEIDFLKPYGSIDVTILSVHGHTSGFNISYTPYLYMLDQLKPQAIYLMGANIPEQYQNCVNILKVRNIPTAYPEGGRTLGDRYYYLRDTTITGNDNLEKPKIEIFPNPTEGLFTIFFGATPVQEALVQIFNLQGTQILSKTHKNTPSATIDLTGNPKGIYLMRLSADSEIFTQKINLE